MADSPTKQFRPRGSRGGGRLRGVVPGVGPPAGGGAGRRGRRRRRRPGGGGRGLHPGPRAVEPGGHDELARGMGPHRGRQPHPPALAAGGHGAPAGERAGLVRRPRCRWPRSCGRRCAALPSASARRSPAYVLDLTQEQVADAMGVAPGTAAATLTTARRQLLGAPGPTRAEEASSMVEPEQAFGRLPEDPAFAPEPFPPSPPGPTADDAGGGGRGGGAVVGAGGPGRRPERPPPRPGPGGRHRQPPGGWWRLSATAGGVTPAPRQGRGRGRPRRWALATARPSQRRRACASTSSTGADEQRMRPGRRGRPGDRGRLSTGLDPTSSGERPRDVTTSHRARRRRTSTSSRSGRRPLRPELLRLCRRRVGIRPSPRRRPPSARPWARSPDRTRCRLHDPRRRDRGPHVPRPPAPEARPADDGGDPDAAQPPVRPAPSDPFVPPGNDPSLSACPPAEVAVTVATGKAVYAPGEQVTGSSVLREPFGHRLPGPRPGPVRGPGPGRPGRERLRLHRRLRPAGPGRARPVLPRHLHMEPGRLLRAPCTQVPPGTYVPSPGGPRAARSAPRRRSRSAPDRRPYSSSSGRSRVWSSSTAVGGARVRQGGGGGECCGWDPGRGEGRERSASDSDPDGTG